jgi:NAD(P)H dehydrogenase (quinone)
MREVDYSRPETLSTALAGVDKVLLISSTAVSGRLPQHRAVIEAAQQAKVSLLAYAGFGSLCIGERV